MYTGQFNPIIKATTNIIIAIAVLTHLLSFAYFKIIPRPTASSINSIEVVATEPFAAILETTVPVSSVAKPLNVPATTSANAAMTRIQNNQTNSRNNFLPSLPIYSSMM